MTTTPGPSGLPDVAALLRSRSYLKLLALAAVLGVPVSGFAYGFLLLVQKLQDWTFSDLPRGLGFHAAPVWWPVPILAVCGASVAAAIRYLPGTGGHSPAVGLVSGGPPVRAVQLPGVFFAAVATLGLGAVLGPEAPLIALGGGLAALAVRAGRDAPEHATLVVAAAGSFAAISTLLGSPLLGAFLLMEVSGLGGPTLGLVLLPGLLSAGIGSLIFIGLGDWSGLGTFSLSIPDLPAVGPPAAAQFGWAIAVGLAAALLGSTIRTLAVAAQPHVEHHRMTATPVLGVGIAGLAVGYAEATGHSASDVLFSGQTALGPLITGSAAYSVGTLGLLLACKGLAYTASLSGFRGGPIFPAMFLGAVGGIALSHLPGLPVVSGAAMGIGAMSVVMLRLPLTSVLLATLLLLADGLTLMPLVIVAVTVAHVTAARLQARLANARPATTGPAAAASSGSPSGTSPPAPPARPATVGG